MKKIIIFTMLLISISPKLFAQTYPKFVISDLIVKKINIGLEQRYKEVGLEVIADFSKPEFLGRKCFDNDAKLRFAYGIAAKWYFNTNQMKKNQHFFSLIGKNTIQKHSFEENNYKKSSRSIGLAYGRRRAFYKKFYYEMNFGLINHFDFRYFDLTRAYEIKTTPNHLGLTSGADLNNPFAGLSSLGQNKKYTYVSLLLNFSLTYQL